MAILMEILASIQGILDDPAYTDAVIIDRINDAQQYIAGGFRMPDGQVSPPLPDLFTYGTVNTSITLPYISLPDNYQRKVFNVYDSSNNRIYPPTGGDYYSFGLFLKQINNMGLTEQGSIYRACVKGKKLYYQGIPTVTTTLGLHYYRNPATLALDDDEPDGLPDHLAEKLLKHYVIMNVYGESIEAGVSEPAIGMKYHESRFFLCMTDLCDFIGIPDAEPILYGSGDYEDRGTVD